MTPRTMLRLAAVVALALCAGAASAQDAHPSARPDAPARPATPDAPPRLPADKTTHHVLDLPGHSLRVVATAGAIRLADAKGAAQADIAFTAYQLEGADTATRPVTFAVNGGPGASSAWLQFGAIGPWRLPIGGDALSPSAPPVVAPNAETWLDFTDLVFIDPAGTGFSRVVAAGDDVRKRLYSVDGDIDSLAEVVRRWLTANGRLVSPKFVVGESYGGFRGPRLVRELQSAQGVGIRGLMMVSPVLDFGTFGDSFPLGLVARLPSLAATAREARMPLDRAAMQDVERYAAGDYLLDLVRGEHDRAALDRMSAKVAELTGLDPALVRRRGGRIDANTFVLEVDRRDARVASAYDATVTTADPFPIAAYAQRPDAILDGLRSPMTSAALELYGKRLEWLPDGQYELLSESVNRQWDYGRSNRRPQSVSDLRTALALDPQFRAVVEHGFTDVVTPYFGSQLILDQIPDLAPSGRLKLSVHPGGHMFYARDGSRASLRDDARALVEGR